MMGSSQGQSELLAPPHTIATADGPPLELTKVWFTLEPSTLQGLVCVFCSHYNPGTCTSKLCSTVIPP